VSFVFCDKLLPRLSDLILKTISLDFDFELN
jgi:hypothetical protein